MLAVGVELQRVRGAAGRGEAEAGGRGGALAAVLREVVRFRLAAGERVFSTGRLRLRPEAAA